MNIEKALTIDGWMNPDELELLAELASKSQLIAEIGSWMGRSTMALAANTPGKVYAVDTWQGSAEQVHAMMLSGKPNNWLFEQFKINTGSADNVFPFQMKSCDAAIHFKDQKFDMIFIDAAHDYDGVKADITAWKPLLKEGGIFCGHDYTPGWPGVVRAVDEFTLNIKTVGTLWVAL